VKLKEALTHAREILDNQHIEDASLIAEVLLRHVLKIDRARFYTELNTDLTEEQKQYYLKLVERRCTGEPTAYITGHREFYGLDFIVDRNVLIPRPETELLVEKALEFAGKHQVSTIADVGTGCGAIVISLVKNLAEDIKIYALDASDEALEIAGKNCHEHGVSTSVELIRSDMLASLTESVDMIVANMPYFKTSELPVLGPLSFEPTLALDGGETGLAAIEQICRQAFNKIRPGGSLLLEIGQGQAGDVRDILSGVFPAAVIEVYPDYAGIERVVAVYLT